jgi:hypothetical protein
MFEFQHCPFNNKKSIHFTALTPILLGIAMDVSTKNTAVNGTPNEQMNTSNEKCTIKRAIF